MVDLDGTGIINFPEFLKMMCIKVDADNKRSIPPVRPGWKWVHKQKGAGPCDDLLRDEYNCG